MLGPAPSRRSFTDNVHSLSQVCDGHTRLGAEDGLPFGSVHPNMAVEVAWWLQELGFGGHVYFDTFPHNEDPVWEAEWNVRAFKAAWGKAARTRAEGRLREAMAKHGGMMALEALQGG